MQKIEKENENDEPVDEKKIIDKVMLRRVDLANLMRSPPKKFEHNDA